MSGRQLSRQAGWLPEPDAFRDWVKTKLKPLREDRSDGLGEVHYTIQDFYDVIERTPVIREAFNRMFFQTLQNLDLRGLEQVRCFLYDCLTLFDYPRTGDQLHRDVESVQQFPLPRSKLQRRTQLGRLDCFSFQCRYRLANGVHSWFGGV